MQNKNFIGSNVTIMVSSMAKSIKFYTDILGLELRVRYSSHWAEINACGMTIGLHPKIKSKKVIQGDNLTIGLEVRNIEKVMKELEARQILFDYKKDSVVKQAYFNDPDGNVLYLFQYNKK